MTNMSIQPLWLTHFIEILLVIEFQLTKFCVDAFSYKAHFRPQISSNGGISWLYHCGFGYSYLSMLQRDTIFFLFPIVDSYEIV